MTAKRRTVGRLAPTPSGELHLGNVLAFGAAWLATRADAGELLLRIEDVDTTRSREHWVEGLKNDLDWLGIHWDRETPRQSLRTYQAELESLGGVYYCRCTRAQLGGLPYMGTCRLQNHSEGAVRWEVPPDPIAFEDRKFGPQRVQPVDFGDPVLKRSDGCFSYNLAVVVDDIRDGVTQVVRGADLLEFTAVQISLWRAFGSKEPSFLHTPMVLGPDGKKLSKSHGSLSIRALRESGKSPQDVWRKVLPWLGLPGDDLHAALPFFRPEIGPVGPIQIDAAD